MPLNSKSFFISYRLNILKIKIRQDLYRNKYKDAYYNLADVPKLFNSFIDGLCSYESFVVFPRLYNNKKKFTYIRDAKVET